MQMIPLCVSRSSFELLPCAPSTSRLTYRFHARSVTVISFIFVGIEGIATELEMVRPALPRAPLARGWTDLKPFPSLLLSVPPARSRSASTTATYRSTCSAPSYATRCVSAALAARVSARHAVECRRSKRGAELTNAPVHAGRALHLAPVDGDGRVGALGVEPAAASSSAPRLVLNDDEARGGSVRLSSFFPLRSSPTATTRWLSSVSLFGDERVCERMEAARASMIVTGPA